MKSLAATLVYHRFTTDTATVGIGSEWDALLELAVDRNTSFLAAVADYQGVGFGGFADKTVTWLQVAYEY